MINIRIDENKNDHQVLFSTLSNTVLTLRKQKGEKSESKYTDNSRLRLDSAPPINERKNEAIEILLRKISTIEEFIKDFSDNQFLKKSVLNRITAGMKEFGTHVFIFNISVRSRQWQ